MEEVQKQKRTLSQTINHNSKNLILSKVKIYEIQSTKNNLEIAFVKILNSKTNLHKGPIAIISIGTSFRMPSSNKQGQKLQGIERQCSFLQHFIYLLSFIHLWCWRLNPRFHARLSKWSSNRLHPQALTGSVLFFPSFSKVSSICNRGKKRCTRVPHLLTKIIVSEKEAKEELGGKNLL